MKPENLIEFENPLRNKNLKAPWALNYGTKSNISKIFKFKWNFHSFGWLIKYDFPPWISLRRIGLFECMVLKRMLNKLEHKRPLVWGNFVKQQCSIKERNISLPLIWFLEVTGGLFCSLQVWVVTYSPGRVIWKGNTVCSAVFSQGPQTKVFLSKIYQSRTILTQDLRI